ncbi:HIT domain-containing protein [Stagnimonas aquatica]|uniref:HIT domain-containing protein n=1 Tax=Stagnimonas aquatica TaxID=2689987 RepID=A0A3N0V233_9GAMM|nr:HIT domain-containing protein [Stagnimonas aquatica]ROH86773.1 HIT domain-containing protein [Stagnimonas aquatica]
MTWTLHAQLAADTLSVGDFPLSRLLLMNESRYPWCILVPRRSGAKELHRLDDADQLQLLRESTALARAMEAAFAPHKMNVAALGNMVPQLHLHHIARYRGDPAWPAPVWGKFPAQAYEPAAAAERIARLRQLLPGLLYESADAG